MAPVIRKVNPTNLTREFKLIDSFTTQKNSFIGLDTEFPGTIFHPGKRYDELSPLENYKIMRSNVNNLKLIQLGITMCDRHGKASNTWEFNFRDFNVEEDLHNPDSVNLLKTQGVDFLKNRTEGISAVEFAKTFLLSKLGFSLRSALGRTNSSEVDPELTWVFFHCTYDLGYLIKLLTQKPLPENPVDFMRLVRLYLGRNVFDLKEMVKVEPFGWECGLNRVAENLSVKRVAGQSHQAGSDSLVTLQCFLAVMRVILAQSGEEGATSTWRKFNYKLYGLALDESTVQLQQDLMRKKKIQYTAPARVMCHPHGGRPVLGVCVPVKPLKQYVNVQVVPLVPVYGL